MQHPKISELTVKYVQDGDTNDAESVQEIEISAISPLLHLFEDGKPAYYLVIKTERWAVDSPEELLTLVNGFIAMIKQD